MESTDKNERLKPGSSGCGEYIVKSKVNEDIKNLQTSVAFLNEEIDKIKTGIPSEHFNPEEMLENNLTTWDATKQKLVTPTDPTSVKVGTEHLATEMDLFNTVHDVIDGTTPVEVVKVGTTDNEGSLLATKKSVDKTLEDYAKLTDVDEETKNRQIADNSIINGTTPIKAIDNEATNLLGNKVATYDNGLVNGLVEYKDGVLVHSTTDITADLAKEVQERKDADALINANLSSLTSRVATEEHKLASETDERQMIDEIIMQDATDIRNIADNAKNLATEAKAKADEVNTLATEAKAQASEANVNSAKAVADVATEVDNRTKADQTLQANIDKSIEYTAGVDGKLSIERGQRAEKDKILQENIDTVAKNLSDETFYRIEDDQTLQANINKVVSGETEIQVLKNGIKNKDGDTFALSKELINKVTYKGRAEFPWDVEHKPEQTVGDLWYIENDKYFTLYIGNGFWKHIMPGDWKYITDKLDENISNVTGYVEANTAAIKRANPEKVLYVEQYLSYTFDEWLQNGKRKNIFKLPFYKSQLEENEIVILRGEVSDLSGIEATITAKVYRKELNEVYFEADNVHFSPISAKNGNAALYVKPRINKLNFGGLYKDDTDIYVGYESAGEGRAIPETYILGKGTEDERNGSAELRAKNFIMDGKQVATQENLDSIVNGTTPIIKAKAGLTDTEGNVFATSDDAFMLYGAQGRDNIEANASLDDIVLCGQKSVNSDALANSITEKPANETGPFDLVVGYFNTDSTQPYQFYIGKNSQKIYKRMTVDGIYGEWKELGSGAGGGGQPERDPVDIGVFTPGEFAQDLEDLINTIDNEGLKIYGNYNNKGSFTGVLIRTAAGGSDYPLAALLNVCIGNTPPFFSYYEHRYSVSPTTTVFNDTKYITDEIYSTLEPKIIPSIGRTVSYVAETPEEAQILVTNDYPDYQFELVKTEKVTPIE